MCHVKHAGWYRGIDQWEKRWFESGSIRQIYPKLFTLRFSNKSVQAPSFANNNCFQIAVQRRNFMKKSVKLACHVVISNTTIGSLPTLQISLAIVVLFENIYDGEPILTVFSNIGEDVQYRCFNVKSVSQPDTMPILENNYCLQIIETGFAEQF